MWFASSSEKVYTYGEVQPVFAPNRRGEAETALMRKGVLVLQYRAQGRVGDMDQWDET